MGRKRDNRRTSYYTVGTFKTHFHLIHRHSNNTGVIMDFDGFDRLYLLYQILPDDGIGSFEQMLATDQLRDQIQFNDEEIEQINFQAGQGQLNFNPQALDALEPIHVDLTDAMKDAIAFGFKRMEQEGELISDRKFVELYRRFEEDIQNN